MKKTPHLILILTLVLSCATLGTGVLKDLPKDRTYTVTVQRVIDRRLPALTASQFKDMLDRMAGHIRDYLGYSVRFKVLPDTGMAAFQKKMAFVKNTEVYRELKKGLLDPEKPEDLQRLKTYIVEMANSLDDKKLDGVFPAHRKFTGRSELASHLYDLYVKKLKAIHSIRTYDGSKLADARFYETLTYPFWDAILQNIKGPHFIFTNTIMADMEVDIPVYVVLRYGITTGMVEKNLHNPYRAAGVMFTYPFLSKAAFFRHERRRPIPPGMLTDVIALYSTHEFGHFFNHYRDYYTHRHCIMVPAMDLDYYGWYLDRKSKRCTLNHEKLKHF